MVTRLIYTAGGRWLAQLGSTGAVVPECEITHSDRDYFYAWCRPDLIGVEFRESIIRVIEIKENRADFTGEMRNRKWEKYLLVADYVYFLVPRGLVWPNEVPGVAGLLWLEQIEHGEFEVRSVKRARRVSEQERKVACELFGIKWPNTGPDIKQVYEAMLRSYHNKYWYNSYEDLNPAVAEEQE